MADRDGEFGDGPLMLIRHQFLLERGDADADVDARQEFLVLERLGEIIVGPFIHAADLVVLFVAGGEKNKIGEAEPRRRP